MARRAISHYKTLRTPKERAVYKEFGRRLQARMIEKGWNQTDLAHEAEMHLPTPTKGKVQGHSFGRDKISCYIRGLYLPRPDALAALAKALDCDPEDLLPVDNAEPLSQATAEESPFMNFTDLPNQRVAIVLKRVVSQKTALAIMVLLGKEDEL